MGRASARDDRANWPETLAETESFVKSYRVRGSDEEDAPMRLNKEGGGVCQGSEIPAKLAGEGQLVARRLPHSTANRRRWRF